jgi:hypothetical protein
MGAKKLQRRSRVKPFIKVSIHGLQHGDINRHFPYVLGDQLLTSFPHALRLGVGELEELSGCRSLQGAITTGGCTEEHQKVVRGALPDWKEQVVLPGPSRMFICDVCCV